MSFPLSSCTVIQRKDVLGFHERRLVVLRILRGGRVILKIQFGVEFKRICIQLKEIGCTLFVNRVHTIITRGSTYPLDIFWGQLIKLIQVVSTSEFHEY